MAKAFDIDVNIFNEPFNESNFGSTEASMKFAERSHIGINKSVSNKQQKQYSESFNERFNQELKEQIHELKSEKEELKFDLKETREELKQSHNKYREMAEKATNYQEKYYETQKLLQSPQFPEQQSKKTFWLNKSLPRWVRFLFWIVLFCIAIISLMAVGIVPMPH